MSYIIYLILIGINVLVIVSGVNPQQWVNVLSIGFISGLATAQFIREVRE